MRRAIFCLILGLFAVSVFADDQLETLLKDIQSSDFETRAAAKEKLLEYGAEALPRLKEIRDHKHPGIAEFIATTHDELEQKLKADRAWEDSKIAAPISELSEIWYRLDHKEEPAGWLRMTTTLDESSDPPLLKFEDEIKMNEMKFVTVTVCKPNDSLELVYVSSEVSSGGKVKRVAVSFNDGVPDPKNIGDLHKFEKLPNNTFTMFMVPRLLAVTGPDAVPARDYHCLVATDMDWENGGKIAYQGKDEENEFNGKPTHRFDWEKRRVSFWMNDDNQVVRIQLGGSTVAHLSDRASIEEKLGPIEDEDDATEKKAAPKVEEEK